MRNRTPLELSPLIGALGLGFACLLCASPARADDDNGHRFGLVAALGGGVAGVVHPGPLPGFIGFTDLGVEIMGEIRPWGGFLRLDYLSSGNDGRWTAFSFSAGTEYRLFGNVHRTALFLRGGLVYERWSGNDAGCPLDFVVPVSCNLEGAKPASFDVTTDMLGVVGGIRLELPISSVYLALSANVVPSVAVDHSNPAGTFQLRFDAEAGFRDVKAPGGYSRARTQDPFHVHTDSTTPFGTK
jgi:hypothetical protein